MSDKVSHAKQDRYHHGDLRRAVIEAALQLIAKKGIESLTLREIAQQVGVSRMAPYRHFESKAVLLFKSGLLSTHHPWSVCRQAGWLTFNLPCRTRCIIGLCLMLR
jgi:hypothetical protein